MDRWTPGFGHEFLQRDDGYPGLAKVYGLQFGSAPRGMELSLIYRALADGTVDVIAGDATSALIDALDLAQARRQPALLSPIRCRAGRSHRLDAATARHRSRADGPGGCRVRRRDASAECGGRCRQPGTSGTSSVNSLPAPDNRKRIVDERRRITSRMV